MKKRILAIASLGIVAIVFVFSCQKENSSEDGSVASAAQKENWLTANLDSKFANSQKQVTAYLFSTNKINALVKTPNVSEVQFVLGYQDNVIQIHVVGVDKSGKELGTVNSTILKESAYDAKLGELNKLETSKTHKRTALLNAHLISHKDAFTGIAAWQEKLNSVSDLNEVTSYEGARFQHFSLESAILEAMTDQGSANIGLFLGLNPKGKVTTILIGLDKENAIKKRSLTSKDGDGGGDDDTYDASRPSPPY